MDLEQKFYFHIKQHRMREQSSYLHIAVQMLLKATGFRSLPGPLSVSNLT